MTRPLSSSQIERLGIRLIQSAAPADDDLALLHQVLAYYSEVLAGAVERVRGLELAPTSRVKNTGTILEKLERYGGSWLKSIHDLAGMRIVRIANRNEQDALVERVVRLFSEESRAPRVVDRRAAPVQGYRAVHVVVFPEGVPVEIQVRTRWQHEWAELFEKLADRIGRSIRYGEPPTPQWTAEELTSMGTNAQKLAVASREVRELTIRLAITVADLVSAVEEVEATTPDSPKLLDNRRAVEKSLSTLREHLDAI
jgi:ppGpp synthetase/RelA/SpoT-type nucleotidyltranferase